MVTYASFNWTQIYPTGIPMLNCGPHEVAIDSIRSSFYFSPNGVTAPTYETFVYSYNYDLNRLDTLRGVGSELPLKRTLPCCTYIGDINCYMLAFGIKDTNLNDSWLYSLNDSSWSRAPIRGDPPPPRHAAMWIFDKFNKKIYLFGGRVNRPSGGFTETNDLWELNISNWTWTQLTPTGSIPSPRCASAVWFDRTRNRMLIWGGHSYTTGFFNQLYSLDLSTMTWSLLPQSGSIPSTRRLVRFSPMQNDSILFLFGGDNSTGGGPMGGLYRLDLITNSWTNIPTSGTIPSNRSTYGFAKIPDQSKIILIGGLRGFWSYCNDFYMIEDLLGISSETQTPIAFSLSAHPNPFNSMVKITLDGVGADLASVGVEIFDLSGRRVAQLPEYGTVGAGFKPAPNDGVKNNERDGAGVAPTTHEYIWTPDETLPSGVYLVRARVGTAQTARRIVYLK